MLNIVSEDFFEREIPLILVVDDDRSLRTLLKVAMEEEGYRVIEAKNGQEGLVEFNRFYPDMVLLDALMPEMDGFTCCQKLKQSQHGQKIPILMITALDDQDSIDRAFTAGAIDYVTKPIHWAVLAQRVKRMLTTSKALNQLQQVQQQLYQQQAWIGLFHQLTESRPSSLELISFLKGLLEQVRILLQIERVILCQKGGSLQIESVEEGYPSIESLTWKDLSLETYYQSEYQQRKAIILNLLSTNDLPPLAITPLTDKETCSALILPMNHQGTVWGYLCFHQCRTEATWTSNELEPLACLATLLMLAIAQTETQFLEVNSYE